MFGTDNEKKKKNHGIYFDNAAHMPLSYDHINAISDVYKNNFFTNPSSNHAPGRVAKKLLEKCRTAVADIFQTHRHDIIFTSGATESNNLIISSVAYELYCKNKHQTKNQFVMSISAAEHSSVYESAYYYCKRYNLDLVEIKLNSDGLLCLDDLKNKLNSYNIGFLAFFHVNHETAIINQIKKICQELKNYDLHIHVDGAQAFAKVDVSFIKDCAVNSYVFSAHKIAAVSGCGGVYVKNNIKNPMMMGGRQELNMRSGSENLFGIISLAIRCEQILSDKNWLRSANVCYNHLLHELKKLDFVTIFGSDKYRLNTQLCFYIHNQKVSDLMSIMDEHKIAIGFGSACKTDFNAPSKVLTAMGVDDEIAANSLRVSFGTFNTIDQINRFLDVIKYKV